MRVSAWSSTGTYFRGRAALWHEQEGSHAFPARAAAQEPEYRAQNAKCLVRELRYRRKHFATRRHA